MALYLLRHGQTDMNLERRMQGHADIELNEEGENQARLVREEIERLGISQVELADRLGVSKSYVTKALKDGRSLSLKSMIQIADALGLAVTVRFGRERR